MNLGTKQGRGKIRESTYDLSLIVFLKQRFHCCLYCCIPKQAVLGAERKQGNSTLIYHWISATGRWKQLRRRAEQGSRLAPSMTDSSLVHCLRQGEIQHRAGLPRPSLTACPSHTRSSSESGSDSPRVDAGGVEMKAFVCGSSPGTDWDRWTLCLALA